MIYLDNAATSLQKPPQVIDAMADACRTCAGYARSGHVPALRAGETVYNCRETAAELFSVDDPATIIFTMNATHALNLAIHGFCTPHTRVTVSGYEHNSVMRPLHALGCPVHILHSKLFDPDDFMKQAEQVVVNGRADLFILNHVSNVFGSIAPLAALDRLLCQYDIPLILDASQSAGILSIAVNTLRSLCAVCMPGHKGLLGPQGTGMLILPREPLPVPLMQGGTGSTSASLEQPAFLPDLLESGTPNIPGIAGLDAGMRWILAQGIETLQTHEITLIRALDTELRTLPQLEIFSHPTYQTGVLSIRLRHEPSELLAQTLSEHDICTRGGLHCAPIAHQSGGTMDTGTVRLSVGPFQTADEIAQAADIIRKIIRAS